jgi:PhoH-like ATPase
LLPAGFRVESNDSRILAVALNLANEGRDVVLVSKDMPLRVKAAAVGLPADEYRVHPGIDSGWTGMAEVEVSTTVIDSLYSADRVEAAETEELLKVAEFPCHTGLVLHSGRGSALARLTPDKQLKLVRWTCCWTPRSASSPSVAGLAPASRRWRCARGWTR